MLREALIFLAGVHTSEAVSAFINGDIELMALSMIIVAVIVLVLPRTNSGE